MDGFFEVDIMAYWTMDVSTFRRFETGIRIDGSFDRGWIGFEIGLASFDDFVHRSMGLRSRRSQLHSPLGRVTIWQA